MTGGSDGVRTSKFSANGPHPKSPAAYFAAQGQTVQKSAKSEPGIKQRTISADVCTVVEQSLPSLRTSMDDMGPMGRRSKPSSPVPGSPKRAASGPLKASSRAPSGRTTPVTGRTGTPQVNLGFRKLTTIRGTGGPELIVSFQ